MASTRSLKAAEQLDTEIASLKDEGTCTNPVALPCLTSTVAALRSRLKVECSTIVSAKSTQNAIRSASLNDSAPLQIARRSRQPAKLVDLSAQQLAYVQQCLYRISNAVTAFKVRDPDPNAVDGGHVVGLRFEIMSRGQFLRPYYVMLNRPFVNSTYLRVHRHTLPPAIPLAGLAARHLPAPKPESDTSPSQDLERFVRTLRREIARYHNRLGVSADLRRGLGLHEKNKENLTANDIVEVGIADIEAKQIKLTWADERCGRLVMDDNGKVLKLMVLGKEGRDWETTKELFGKYERIEDVTTRLEEYAAGDAS